MGIYRKRGGRLGLLRAKCKRNKEILWICGWKIAYTGHFCPFTGKDKSGKLGYFPYTGTENNIFPLPASVLAS